MVFNSMRIVQYLKRFFPKEIQELVIFLDLKSELSSTIQFTIYGTTHVLLMSSVKKGHLYCTHTTIISPTYNSTHNAL